MKQKLTLPVAAAITVVVVGALGYFLYRQFLAEPAVDVGTPKGITAAPMKPAQIPRTKEEGMALYRGAAAGKR